MLLLAEKDSRTFDVILFFGLNWCFGLKWHRKWPK